jgi:hypothetical protein
MNRSTFNRLVPLCWLLNVYDTVITLYGTQSLKATEFNPLMRLALEFNPALFVAIKLLVMSIVCWVLYQRIDRHPKKTWALLWMIFGLFTTIGLWNTAVVVALG